MNFDELCDEVREMCSLQQEQPITLKWIDNEGISDLPKYVFANIYLGYVLQNNLLAVMETLMGSFLIWPTEEFQLFVIYRGVYFRLQCFGLCKPKIIRIVLFFMLDVYSSSLG